MTHYTLQAEIATKVVELLLKMHGQRKSYDGVFITDRYRVAAAVGETLRNIPVMKMSPPVKS